MIWITNIGQIWYVSDGQKQHFCNLHGYSWTVCVTGFTKKYRKKLRCNKNFNFIPGVTILLSLTVFLNMVSATMPVTSDNPLLGK